MINARSETIGEKPSFREAFKKRRCIIPASGFYEWQAARGKGMAKQPFHFYLNEREVFGFAGLWEEWLDKMTSSERYAKLSNQRVKQMYLQTIGKVINKTKV